MTIMEVIRQLFLAGAYVKVLIGGKIIIGTTAYVNDISGELIVQQSNIKTVPPFIWINFALIEAIWPYEP